MTTTVYPETLVIERIEREIQYLTVKRANLSRVIRSVADLLTEHIERNPSVVSKKNGKPLATLGKDDLLELDAEIALSHQGRYQAWLHRDTLNTIIFELRKKKLLKSPYLNIPREMRRFLIAHHSTSNPKEIEIVKSLGQYLLDLHPAPSADAEHEELDYLTSFIASACIFGVMLHPEYWVDLLSLRWSQVSLDPLFIEIPMSPGNDMSGLSFYRYHMPAPASVHFMRCVLFYRRNWRKLGLRKYPDPDGPVFPVSAQKSGFVVMNFPLWVSTLFPSFQHRVTLQSFCKSVLFSHALPSKQWIDLPPLLLAVHSRQLRGDSVGRSFFLNSPKEAVLPVPRNASPEYPDDLAVSFPIRMISCSIRALHRDNSPSARRIAAGLISEIVESFRDMVPAHTHRNLELYMGWAQERLAKSGSSKTITNYSSDIFHLMKRLDRTGAIDTVEADTLVQALSDVISLMNSRNITKGLKDFTGYLVSLLGKDFKVPNWRLKKLRGNSLTFVKPLLYPDHIQRALDHAHDLFTGYISRLTQPELKRKHLIQAIAKTRCIRHMIMLGFHAGLRASEFCNLRVYHISFDSGVKINVRHTKTRNGVRDIPLSMLAPSEYVREFESYVLKRMKKARGRNEPLFVMANGKRWDSSHLSSEVGRLFAATGNMNMRFHYLRHSFSNWFLLRWFKAFHGEFIPPDLPFFKDGLFEEQYLEKMRKLCLGESNKTGQDNFSYSIQSLASIVGHGGPIVTVENYIHTCDWLFYFITLNLKSRVVQLSSVQAESFLQRSFPNLPATFRGRGKKEHSYASIHAAQLSRFLS